MTSSNENVKKKKRSPLGTIIKLGVVALIAGAIYLVMSSSGTGINDSQTFVLRRGTLPITVTANGNVRSLAPHHIKAEIRERDVKILSIVEEGRRITREDIDNNLLLVELDSSGMEDNILDDELEYEESVAEYSRAQQDLEILKKENESEIEAAERDVKFKAMDFKKYIGETLANEVIDEIALQHMASNTLEELQRTTILHRNAESEARRLLQRAIDARAQEGGDTTLAVPTETPESAQANPAPTPGNAPGAASSESENGASSLAMIAANAGSLLGGASSGPQGFERYGLEADIKSAAELEQAAEAKRLESNALKEQMEMARAAFLEAAQAAALDSSRFDGDPLEWETDFEAIDFAKLGQDPRLGGESAQEREQLRTEIMLDQEEILMSKKSLEGSEELFANDFIPETELERERLAFDRKSRMLALKQETQRLFFMYDFPKLAEQAYADYEEAVRVLERVRTTTMNRMAAARVDLASAQTSLVYHEEEIRENEELIKNYKIYAETEGLVVYGDPGGNSRYFQDELIKEGSTVREGQTLLTIPDITQMAVEVNIHEAAIKKVNNGLKARVFIEAFPEEDVTAEVVKVAVLPSSSSRYMNPDLKLYETTVDIDGIHEWLKPGMTAKVEIYVDQLRDVLFVPLQAVTTYGGERVCYLADGERRVIETGQYSDNYIEIKAGLEEGDEILLDLRPFKGQADDEASRNGLEEAVQESGKSQEEAESTEEAS